MDCSRPLDHRRALILPDRVELDQEVVRPNHRLQNLHPFAILHEVDTRAVH